MSSSFSGFSEQDLIDAETESGVDLMEIELVEDSNQNSRHTTDSFEIRPTRLRKRDLALSPQLKKPSKQAKSESSSGFDTKMDQESISALSVGSFSTLSSYTITESKALDSESEIRTTSGYPSVHDLIDTIARVGESMNFHCGRLTSTAFKAFTLKTGKTDIKMNDPMSLKNKIIAPSDKPTVIQRTKTRGRPCKILPQLYEVLESSQNSLSLLRSVDRNLGAPVASETILDAYELPFSEHDTILNIRHPFLHPWEKDEDCAGGGRWRRRRRLYLDMADKLSLEESLVVRQFKISESKENQSSYPNEDNRRLGKRTTIPKRDFSPPSNYTDGSVLGKRLQVLHALQPQIAGFRWDNTGEADTLIFWR